MQQEQERKKIERARKMASQQLRQLQSKRDHAESESDGGGGVGRVWEGEGGMDWDTGSLSMLAWTCATVESSGV